MLFFLFLLCAACIVPEQEGSSSRPRRTTPRRRGLTARSQPLNSTLASLGCFGGSLEKRLDISLLWIGQPAGQGLHVFTADIVKESQIAPRVGESNLGKFPALVEAIFVLETAPIPKCLVGDPAVGRIGDCHSNVAFAIEHFNHLVLFIVPIDFGTSLRVLDAAKTVLLIVFEIQPLASGSRDAQEISDVIALHLEPVTLGVTVPR